MAMVITTVLALVAGVYAASRHNKIGDVGVMGLAQIGIAIPNFWFAILLILLFSVKLQWFSAGGFPGWTEDAGGSPLEALKALLLPAIALAVVQAAILVVEIVFYLPGLGRLIFQSISNRDLIVVRNCVMLLAAMVVIVNFVVDILYAVIDPRVKASDI